MAITVTKIGVTYPKSQETSMGMRDFVLEVVGVTFSADAEAIDCALSAGHTQVVRTPLAAWVCPTNAAAAAEVGAAAGTLVEVSGATITFTGVASASTYDVFIFGRP